MRRYRILLRRIRHTLNPDLPRTTLLDSFGGLRAHALLELNQRVLLPTSVRIILPNFPGHEVDRLFSLGDILEDGLPNDDSGEGFVWCIAYIMHLDKVGLG